MAFRGTFEHALDAKGRLTIPARFRPALSDGVVLAKDNVAPCVAIWTPEAYDQELEHRMATHTPGSKSASDLRRFYNASSHEDTLDAAGRVMMPGFLGDHAGLAKDVTVLGVGDHLEVWDREAWVAYSQGLDQRVTELSESLDASA
jgi:MraZ protein